MSRETTAMGLPTSASVSGLLRTLSLLMVLNANSISPDYHDVSLQATEAALGSYHDKGNTEGKLRVLNINMWGLKWPLAMHQRERFKALSGILKRSHYDVVLLQEVWYRYQYDIIKDTFPYVSPFRTLNGCSGRFPFPIECSGLVILSRHPVKKFWYESYSVRGWLIIDGQFAVRKGLGIARIWWNGLNVDVSTSHLSTYTMSAMENLHERMVQTMETVEILRKSSADVKIWGGDLNALPDMTPADSPYRIMASYMRDSLLDFYGPGANDDPRFFTYGNRRNSFTADTHLPGRIDYIFHMSRPGVEVSTHRFVLPPLKAAVDGRWVSITDHEPLLAELDVRKVEPSYG